MSDHDPAAGGRPVPKSVLTHRQVLAILGGLMVGMFLAALDQTIVTTSIRTIADDLRGYHLQAWVSTAYLVTSTIVTPLYGKMSDLHGRKPLFLLAISVFIAGSLLCSIATTMYELAAFRAVQGIGAGGLFTLALTTIGDIMPPRQRARYQGYFLAVFGTSSVLGPVIGGFFAAQPHLLWISGWRWVFLVNVPLGIIALIIIFHVLDHDRAAVTTGRSDYWGASALAVAVAPLLIVAEQGRHWGWTSAISVLCYGVGVLGLVAFVVIERRLGDDALIPLRVFRNRVFTQGIVVSVVIGAVMFGAISMLPQYFQVLRGSSPMVAGLQMLPMVLGMMVGSVSSGRLIARTGRYKVFTVVGSVLITAATFLLHGVDTETPVWLVMIFAALLGLGLGNLTQPVILALQNILPAAENGLSTGTATFFRQLGGTLGIAVFFSLLFATMGPNIASEIRSAATQPGFRAAVVRAATDTDPQVREFAERMVSASPVGAAERAMSDTSIIEKLPTALSAPIKKGFVRSMENVFGSVSLLSVLVIIGTLTWREFPLRAGGSAVTDVTAGD